MAFLILTALILLSFVEPVLAGASAGMSFGHSSVRIFGTDSRASWNAGLEISLADRWKTYWRVPGESGVPPQFDWSASHNLKNISVGWPAPQRIVDEGGESIGYTGDVVFPLHVVPADPTKPVELSLSFFYAACKDICIPVTAFLGTELLPGSSGAPADNQRVESFAKKIPLRPEPLAVPAIAELSLDQKVKPNALSVTLRGSLAAGATDMFVEGGNFLYFRKPEAQGAGAETSRFLLPIDGLQDAKDLRGKPLTVTVVSGNIRLVQTLTVD